MSWRHSFLSKPIEALISCITTEGPAAKRPPHCWLASALRRALWGAGFWLTKGVPTCSP